MNSDTNADAIRDTIGRLGIIFFWRMRALHASSQYHFQTTHSKIRASLYADRLRVVARRASPIESGTNGHLWLVSVSLVSEMALE